MDCNSSSSSEDDTQSDTWVIGDRCLVHWSGDGEAYPAKIIKFRKGTISTDALVRFSGYGSEEDEWLDTRKLRHRQQQKDGKTKDDVTIIENQELDQDVSIFCPLEGNEEKKRIEDKYKYLDEEESSSGSDRRWPTTKKRLVMPDLSIYTGKSLKGRAVKSRSHYSKTARAIEGPVSRGRNSQRSTESPKESPHSSRRSKGTSAESTLSLSADESGSDDSHGRPGFSPEELEKPYFPKIKPRGPKTPFLLSKPGTKPEIKIPATINRYLRDYQREGVQFMYRLYESGDGGLLADDMGLGKTVQVISVIAALLCRTGTKTDIWAQKPSFIRKLSDSEDVLRDIPKRDPFLVIGPASVLYNWLDEFDTWGYFTIGKYHKNYKAQTVSSLRRRKLDVVLTTYETFRENVDELNQFSWEAVFADECHKIKDLKAEVTRALRQISCTRRFGLTGTPLQNSVQELWSLMDWCNEGCLGDWKEFRANYGIVIERGQKHSATKRELAEGRKAQEKLAKLRDRWMLRRLKTLISDQLPKKNEHVVYCRATELQVSVYQAVFDLEHMEAVLKQSDPCPCDSGRTRGKCCYKKLSNGKSVWAMTMSYMHLLLKAANHIALLLPSHTSSENQRKEAEKVCATVFSKHPQFVEQTRAAAFRTLSDPKYCGKMKVLQGLLSVFKKQKSKVLLFSYSTQLLDILELYVMSSGYEYRRLDGTTKEQARVQLVKDFNNDANIFLFLISTKAGGVGLNLTGANIVIIYDPNWNPTHDLQAQDRAYRIGQRRDVTVYRLITSGTIEENIYLRQIHKQSLGEVAVATKNAKRLFNTSELFGIKNTFHFRTGDHCLTEDILQRHTKIAENLNCRKTAKNVGLEGFVVDEYVPPQSSNGDDEKADAEDEVENENKEEQSDAEDLYIQKRKHHHSGPNETDFGLGYVCTQLMDEAFSDDEESDQDQSRLSPQRPNVSTPRKNQQQPSPIPNKTKISTSPGDRLPTDRPVERVAKKSTPKKPPQRKRLDNSSPAKSKPNSEESVDDFLEDLLDLGSPKSKRKKDSTNAPQKSKKSSVMGHSGLDIWDEIEHIGASDSNDCEEVTEKQFGKKAAGNDDILDEIWEEMESFVSVDSEDVKRAPKRVMAKGISHCHQREDDSFKDTKHVAKGGPYKGDKQLKISGGKDRRESMSSKTRKELKKDPKGHELNTEIQESSTIKLKNKTKHNKDPDDNLDISFLTAGGTMECDFLDSDEDEQQRKRKRRDKKTRTVRISESRNKIHEPDVNPRTSEIKVSEGEIDSYKIGTYASVSDVFADCNVIHMHQNRRVTGSSKAEDHMTRCALQDVYERGCDSQAPAVFCQPIDQTSHSSEDESFDEVPIIKQRAARRRLMKQESTTKGKKSASTSKGQKRQAAQEEKWSEFFQGPRSIMIGRKKVLIGQTPKGVCKQQFHALGEYVHKQVGDSTQAFDAVAFAEKVLSSTRGQHQRWLEGYYGNIDAELEKLILEKETS